MKNIESVKPGYQSKKNYRKHMHGLINDSYNAVNIIIHRDQTVYADEVYNIYKKIQETYYKRANDQKESIKILLEELKTKVIKFLLVSTTKLILPPGFHLLGNNNCYLKQSQSVLMLRIVLLTLRKQSCIQLLFNIF